MSSQRGHLCFTARALGHSIFTEVKNFNDLKPQIREAVLSYFEENQAPAIIRIHFVKEEVFALVG